MKPNRVATLLALCVVTCSNPDTIDVQKKSVSTVYKANIVELALDTLTLGQMDNLTMTHSKELENEGVKANQIDSVKMRSFTLSIRPTSTHDSFDFLQRLEVYAQTSSLPKVLIASGENFGSATTIDLDVEDVELAEYIAAPSMKLKTRATGKSPDHDILIETTTHMDVDVNVRGAMCGG